MQSWTIVLGFSNSQCELFFMDKRKAWQACIVEKINIHNHTLQKWLRSDPLVYLLVVTIELSN